MTKAKKGGLRDTPAETLLATLIKETLTRSRVDPSAVGDLVVGSVLGSNVWRANQARLAAFLGGLPESVRWRSSPGNPETRSPHADEAARIRI